MFANDCERLAGREEEVAIYFKINILYLIYHSLYHVLFFERLELCGAEGCVFERYGLPVYIRLGYFDHLDACGSLLLLFALPVVNNCHVVRSQYGAVRVVQWLELVGFVTPILAQFVWNV